MDLEQFREALGEEKFSELETIFGDLKGQRDQARNESISGRKKLKSDLQTLTEQRQTLLEKLGVDDFDAVESLDLDVQGSAEVAKQFEAKLKRAERERDSAIAERDTMKSDNLGLKKKGILNSALGGHKFIANDVVESFVSNRLVWEGDDLYYKQEDGNLVTVQDGVAQIAKSRPELLEATGAGGAGVRPGNTGSNAGQTTISRKDFEARPHDERAELVKSGVTIQ